MDWTALGAIAALGTAAIAYFQFRGRGPAKIEYRIVRSTLELRPPTFPELNDFPKAQDFLFFTKRMQHASVFLWNRSSHATGEVKLEISMHNFAQGNIEHGSSLGGSVCKFRVVKDSILILEISDLPPKEKIIISLLGSHIGYTLKTLNSNVRVSAIYNDFAWK